MVAQNVTALRIDGSENGAKNFQMTINLYLLELVMILLLHIMELTRCLITILELYK